MSPEIMVLVVLVSVVHVETVLPEVGGGGQAADGSDDD